MSKKPNPAPDLGTVLATIAKAVIREAGSARDGRASRQVNFDAPGGTLVISFDAQRADDAPAACAQCHGPLEPEDTTKTNGELDPGDISNLCRACRLKARGIVLPEPNPGR